MVRRCGTPSPVRWRGARRLGTLVPLVLALVPPVLLVRAAARDTVAVPWMDQWTFARLVVRAHEGTLGLADLWEQHNEHRVPVTKVLLLALAKATAWDVRWEVAATVGVGLAGLLVVAWMLVRTAPRGSVGILVLVASALQCSLAQWQNWTWGWQLGLLLAEGFAIVVAAALLRLPAAPRWWSAVAMLAAVAGALSNGAGLTLLAIVPVLLVVARWAGARVSSGTILVAVTAGAATVVAYASGWAQPVGQPAAAPIRGHVVDLLEYAFTFLGSPIAPWDGTVAWRWGVVVCAVVAVATVVAWLRDPTGRRAVLPWLALAAFGVGTALLTAGGRSATGMHTARLSRYTTFAIPLWIAAGPLVALALATLRGRTTRLVVAAALVPVAGLAAWHGGRSWMLGNDRMAGRAMVARKVAACIVDPATAPDACWRTACWDPRFAREQALALQRDGLGPWAP